MSRAEMPAGFDFDEARTGLQMYLRIRFDEIGGEFHNLVCGACDLQLLQNLCRRKFVHENPPVLRVILKLDDVIVAVVGFQQVSLCATPHLPDEPVRVYRHRACGKSNSTTRGSIN